ncbi:diadenosine tetraphosphate (Ap4A) hydrolase [Agrilactobacillus composti DSM 18527 = JCM 14202]|uniref:Diadenosine tetraphosphate (Ap4A) hydrolase n=1 Tax=Agrilactobacillus composti DSM 18527 = JCM 14202 TaxID=1423734 RepID=X0PCZ7_9LACO|nr:HIT family protein [Agrilactobacillus composti]KRM33110.1 diadenosine tetraphosphate (Ap4A) hydrolase [Agrilactobacillus composti DSM 18527 = JCM 14202]GAF38533.1 diadenosine tetraphosphate (Ap4A) hydrolase [Agrilactobacillus composti DSM 18527 = JCM 14202]
MEKAACVFCQRKNIKIVLENELAVAFWDSHPVNKGHLLIIPKAHKVTYFDLSDAELLAINALSRQGKALIDQTFSPAGYNVGFNVGHYGGQTVMHCHCHLIPRYIDDDPHPAGGIRKLLPNGGEI